MGLHPANAYQLPTSGAAQHPVPQMYPEQFQVQQYPNFLPYRHVYSAQYGSPMPVPNYSNVPAYPQLPHANSYLVMPNGASQLAANGMKYGSPHQYKQIFQGTPAGYGGYSNHNGHPISNGVIGSTGAIEDANMNKYKDNSIYAPNPQVSRNLLLTINYFLSLFLFLLYCLSITLTFLFPMLVRLKQQIYGFRVREIFEICHLHRSTVW